LAPYVNDPNTYTDSFFCTSGVTAPFSGAVPVVALGGDRVYEERGREGGRKEEREREDEEGRRSR
jgi:hypothetical protein